MLVLKKLFYLRFKLNLAVYILIRQVQFMAKNQRSDYVPALPGCFLIERGIAHPPSSSQTPPASTASSVKWERQGQA